MIQLALIPMKRRDLLKAGSLGGAAFALGLLGNRARAQAPSPAPPAVKSLSPLKITRNKFGEDIELLHDMHERVEPIEAIKLCKDLEQFRQRNILFPRTAAIGCPCADATARRSGPSPHIL